VFISYLGTCLAVLMLITPIVVLYRIQQDDLKLGLIVLFTSLFAASVGVMTNAKRVEVFGATAA
jgi:hypothetical protein